MSHYKCGISEINIDRYLFSDSCGNLFLKLYFMGMPSRLRSRQTNLASRYPPKRLYFRRWKTSRLYRTYWKNMNIRKIRSGCAKITDFSWLLKVAQELLTVWIHRLLHIFQAKNKGVNAWLTLILYDVLRLVLFIWRNACLK